MKINKQLNLVITIKRTDGSSLFVHSTPLPAEIFQLYFERAGQTMNALYTRGLGLFAPRYAYDMLKKLSLEYKDWEGPSGVEIGFMAAIRRLSVVILLNEKGWDHIPLENAIKNDLTDSEISEIYGALVFFTCASRSHLTSDQNQWEGALTLFGARIESLSSMELMNSLPIPTEVVSIGVTAAA